MMKTNLALCLALVASLVVSPVTAANSSDLEVARANETRRLVEEILIDAELSSPDRAANSVLSFDPIVATSSNRDGLRSFDDARRLYTTHDAVSLGAFQDEPPPSGGGGDGKLVDKSDQTGTNPINFTFDLRVYNEYLWLNTAGDGDQNITTLEFRAPFADGKWQFRVRARANVINADLNDDGVDELDESGFGDVDFRFLTVPYVNPEKRIAFAVGLEVFLDTASDEALGSGSTSLGPQVFLVFFKPFGLDIDLFAPAYQHKFSIDGNDVNQSLIDLFILKTSEDKSLWVLVDPAIVIDHEANTEFMLIDIELGTMLDKYLGTKGHSAFVRPSVGIGIDRPYNASLEVGYKIVF